MEDNAGLLVPSPVLAHRLLTYCSQQPSEAGAGTRPEISGDPRAGNTLQLEQLTALAQPLVAIALRALKIL